MSVEWIIIGLLAALVLYLFLKKQGGDTTEVKAALARMEGRLSQVAEDGRKSQSELSKTVQDSLGKVSERMGKSLSETAEKTAKSMGEVNKHLKVIDDAQNKMSDLSTSLSQDISQLQGTLSNKQARGAFGEVQLKAIIEDLLPPSMFKDQATLSNRKTVDFQILMPVPSGPLSVDSKFPLSAYEKIINSKNDAELKEANRQFKTDIKVHLNKIAENYIIAGETAEFAVMFVPSEAVVAEINSSHRDLVELGHRLRVNITSPSTLWASILAIKSVFKDIKMQEQAGLIQKEVIGLLDETGRLDDRIDELAGHFNALSKLDEDIRKIRITTGKITQRSDRIRDVRLDEDDSVIEGDEISTPPRLVVDKD
jgi:DNA recombination protein RmuC